MEEYVNVYSGELQSIKLSDSGIKVIKDRTILAPGIWNGRNYSKEEITKCFQNTSWDDPDVISLISDHRDDDSKGRPLTLRDWLGFTTNHYLTEDGFIKADLHICDPILATKLIDGKAPFGISPFVYGKYDEFSNSQVDFVIKNNAIVVEPACKESYINAYLGDDKLNEKLEGLSNEDRINKRVKKDNNVKLEETCTGDISGTSIDSKGLQPVKTKKKNKKSNFTQVKGGKTKMEEEKIENVEEESTEVEEVSEPVEEVSEVVEESESVEEESEDKLMEQLANITDKLMNKRKLTPEQAKIQKLEKDISSIKEMITKLSEIKTEVKESKSEKLSAKPRTMARTIPNESGFKVFGKEPTQATKDFAHMLGY